MNISEIIEIDQNSIRDFEQLGTKEKYWIEFRDGGHALFKKGRPDSGEHWAEVVTSLVANLLGIPHADYRFARFMDEIGVLTPSMLQAHGAKRLVHGNELLSRTTDNYNTFARDPGPAYNLEAIHEALSSYTCIDGTDATEGFGAYLLLDCLVGNQDRHHENWGVLERNENSRVLAPTFDHASSLGCRITDTERLNRLDTNDRNYTVQAFASRAKTWFAESRESERNRLPTIEVAHIWYDRFVRTKSFSALQSLRTLGREDWERVMATLPSGVISRTTAIFVVEFLEANRRRILELSWN
ncbi:MAG: HipA domain-containing protein [Rhodothermales bacterium]